ncbi:hypothetical protein BGV47_16245 [Burkholderia ubonensis]|uniref:hypothetical protein n=1 Tax=Burkholderia ubonensis TaxID=101571 RepID=UPI0008FE52C8|nr:hypothetical protein [Burkholderia ubonensis]OJA37883.1 hypothetical protein BGV47_16245 [Burkholderia ubonensis]OJB29485.1 hypothetical protein BGV55_15395 [Burkholderia ubonensis]
MSDHPTDDQPSKTVKPFLPPMFGPVMSGKRTWKEVKDVDHDLMGYLLSCHLMLEHYIDTFVKAAYPQLDWDAAKLTFGQRIALLSKWDTGTRYDPVSAIKHLNSLRNRLGHRVDYTLSHEDLLPFVYYLERATEQKVENKSPRALLEAFTSLCAAFFAGSVHGADDANGRMR